jgi:opacity protein-like surface antigen
MNTVRQIIIIGFLTALLASPLTAQTRQAPPSADVTPSISLRPFFVVSGQRFAANDTFNAVFGQSIWPFWGGGLQVVFRDGFYFDVAASRFRKTGQRVFHFNGQNFGLGIPLTATETPVEISGGYRFTKSSRVTPYAGAGFGSYGYTETSNFAETGDDVDARHFGYLLVGGVEFRVSRWVALSADAQYTHVPGILGAGGVSQDLGERDLGGVAARFKVIVGR